MNIKFDILKLFLKVSIMLLIIPVRVHIQNCSYSQKNGDNSIDVNENLSLIVLFIVTANSYHR